MTRELFNTVGLGAFALMLAAGQFLFKLTAQRAPAIQSLQDLRHLLGEPMLWLALVLYGAATLLWIYLLQRVALVHAYPFAALAFVLVPIGAVMFFGERVSGTFMVGALFIVIGICMTALSQN
jgi:drug/metabolite transporter (DMT)-like permease